MILSVFKLLISCYSVNYVICYFVFWVYLCFTVQQQQQTIKKPKP